MAEHEQNEPAYWHRLVFDNCGLAGGRDEWAVASRAYNSRREANRVARSVHEIEANDATSGRGFLTVESECVRLTRRLYVVSVIGLMNSTASGPQPYYAEPPDWSWPGGSRAPLTPAHIAELVAAVLRRSST